MNIYYFHPSISCVCLPNVFEVFLVSEERFRAVVPTTVCEHALFVHCLEKRISRHIFSYP